MNTNQPYKTLNKALMNQDSRNALWNLVKTGWADKNLPELTALKIKQHPKLTHKEVLAHSIIVVTQTPARIRVRLAALFHDIGKPRTLSYKGGKVSFHNHEAVGASMVKKIMPRLGYDKQLTKEVAELVRLSGRFKGYSSEWSDKAVHRYVADAGSLIQDLNDLIRGDCTSRKPTELARLGRIMDHMESRIQTLAKECTKKEEPPLLTGGDVMKHLKIKPGREIGEALRLVSKLEKENPKMGKPQAFDALDKWWNTKSAKLKGNV